MLVIDAQPLIRQAIGRIVNAEPDLIDVGRLPLPGEGLCDEAVSATFSFSRAPTLVPRNVAKLIRELQVDALICGMHFPTIDGLALVRNSNARPPRWRSLDSRTLNQQSSARALTRGWMYL